MKYFGIQQGRLSGTINVGLLDRRRTRFLGGEDIVDLDDSSDELVEGIAEYLAELHHEDCTDVAIGVVAEHILDHYDGTMSISYTDGTAFTITVARTTPEAIADNTEPVQQPGSDMGPDGVVTHEH